MTRGDFDNLVRAVENGVGRDPEVLRRRVVMLALLGYFGLLLWLIVVVVIAAGFLVAMVWVDDTSGKVLCGLFGFLVLLGGGYASFRALLVKPEPPKGRIVTREETPALHAMLDQLQSEMRSAPFHRVMICDDFNAGVNQVPRLGLLGWQRNHLRIGLPLMDAMSAEEIRAVLAHEFAHLSREHGRVSHWLYRLRLSWQQLFMQMSTPRVPGEVSLRPMMVKFVDWFWPKFDAHAFVLSRANEYEADAHAAQIVGANWIGSSLSRMALISHRFRDKFWSSIWQEANEKRAPPNDVFSRWRDVLRSEFTETDRSRWMMEALQEMTTNADTHPCLTERLTALHLEPSGHFPERPPVASAADTLLGTLQQVIRADVQKQWEQEVAEQWKQRHGRASALTHRLDSLHQAVANPEADVDSLWDKVRVLLDLQDDDKARPLLQQILALQPEHAFANFHLGRLLLMDRNARGETYMEAAMTSNDELVPAACELLREHHRRDGRMDKLKEIEARMDHYEKDLEASQKEHRELSAQDTLVPHGLGETELAGLQSVLAAESDLKHAWLGRKELKYRRNQKLFLLCIQSRRAWYQLPSQERDQALVSRLAQTVQLPGRMFVFSGSGSYGALARKLKDVSGSGICLAHRS